MMEHSATISAQVGAPRNPTMRAALQPTNYPNSQRRAYLGALVAATLLSACALPGRRVYVGKPGIWRGRLAFRTEEEQPQSQSAAFTLRGSAEQGELEVYNPLGSIVAQLQWGASGASLASGSDRYTSDSLDELVARIFGSPIPIDGLFAWLAGEDVAVVGWRVDLSRYGEGRISAVREQPLPRANLRVILQSPD